MPADPNAVESRRDRLRAEMLASIREHAYAQLEDGGAESLSLNAIAKAIGVSGPALYRYYASRDDLLATLVAESWEAMAETMEQAAEAAADWSAPDRFRAEAAAYRGWALRFPHRYRLLHGTRFGTGTLDPERIVPAAHRTMLVVLDTVADLPPTSRSRSAVHPDLARQLQGWAQSRPDDSGLPSDVLLRGILTHTRIHGILSLEIEGHFTQLGLDGSLLYDDEIEHLIGGGAPQ